jgi:hypothetical protein
VWPGGARADNELVIDIEPDRFEEMVTTALDGLPEDLGTHMRNAPKLPPAARRSFGPRCSEPVR